MKSLLIVLSLLMLCTGCGSGSVSRDRLELSPVYGSTLEGVTAERTASTVRLNFESLPLQGQFVRLALEPGAAVVSEDWTGDSATLHLVAPVEAALEIGLVPTVQYGGGTVQLTLRLGEAARSASTPPSGERNVITDLAVVDAGSGSVELSWTQINVGDYDFNGEVNISDLTPLAIALGTNYDRSAAGADQTTQYWVDGDGNGEINIADVTPIGSNYRSQIVGYNVRHAGVALPGSPTVSVTQAQHRELLPNRYVFTASGSTTNNWVVAPVDVDGVEGADSAGNLGPVQLITNIDINGVQLYDYDTDSNSGGFGPGKVSSRVIDPIDIVNRSKLGSTSLSGTTARSSNLPAGRTLLVDILYRPTINLLTGAPRGGSSIKGVAAVGDEVVTSVIFPLPAGTQDPALIDAAITLSPNPEGGYFVDLTAHLEIPAGDNPNTLPLEDGYTETQRTRLDFASGLVIRDTDGNGEFDDEASLGDEDRDCVSGAQLALSGIDDDHDDDSEVSIEGIVSSFDEGAGVLVLTGVLVDDDDDEFPSPPDPAIVHFDERTRFWLRHRTDENDNGEPFELIDPSTIAPGDKLEVYLRLLDDGSLDPHLWGWEIKKVVDDRS